MKTVIGPCAGKQVRGVLDHLAEMQQARYLSFPTLCNSGLRETEACMMIADLKRVQMDQGGMARLVGEIRRIRDPAAKSIGTQTSEPDRRAGQRRGAAVFPGLGARRQVPPSRLA